ncbi:hypothetical protein H9P43_002875 [Blastocladiella emersonii ATCC 22665]|nr:hypothetical protein H9P43_002875 [Blastocladiella emersonii ATCC 22665]
MRNKNLGGLLANAELAFLDEIFQASKATLPSLITILNEYRIANGSTMVDTPLHVCFGASNEVPLDASQATLMDRVPLRVFVDYVNPTTRLALLFLGLGNKKDGSPVVRINLGDVAGVGKRVQALGNKLANPAMIALFTDLHEYINGNPPREAQYRADGPPAAATTANDAAASWRKGVAAAVRRAAAHGRTKDNPLDVYLVVFAHGRTKDNPLDVYPVVYVAWQTKNQHQCLGLFLKPQAAGDIVILDKRTGIANGVAPKLVVRGQPVSAKALQVPEVALFQPAARLSNLMLSGCGLRELRAVSPRL